MMHKWLNFFLQSGHHAENICIGVVGGKLLRFTFYSAEIGTFSLILLMALFYSSGLISHDSARDNGHKNRSLNVFI